MAAYGAQPLAAEAAVRPDAEVAGAVAPPDEAVGEAAVRQDAAAGARYHAELAERQREEAARARMPQVQADLRSLSLPSGFFDGAESESNLNAWKSGGEARQRMLVGVLFDHISDLRQQVKELKEQKGRKK